MLPFGNCELLVAIFFSISGTILEMLHCNCVSCVKRHSGTANVLGGRLPVSCGRVAGQGRVREWSGKTVRAWKPGLGVLASGRTGEAQQRKRYCVRAAAAEARRSQDKKLITLQRSEETFLGKKSWQRDAAGIDIRHAPHLHSLFRPLRNRRGARRVVVAALRSDRCRTWKTIVLWKPRPKRAPASRVITCATCSWSARSQSLFFSQ